MSQGETTDQNNEEDGLIIKELAASRGAQPPEFLDASKDVAKLPDRLKRSLLVEALATPVENALASWGPFKNGGSFLISRDNGRVSFAAQQASVMLVNRVLAGATPGEAVEMLRAILSMKEAQGTGIMALRGVTVAAPIDLVNGIRLIPFEMLPASWNKSSLMTEPIPEHMLMPPTCALTIPHTVSPLLYSTKAGKPPEEKDPLFLYTLLEDAKFALTLVGPSVPVSAGYWFQFNDPALDSAGSGGRFISRGIRDPWRLFSPTNLDPKEVESVVNAFLTLAEPLRSRLRLSLNRLNQAIGQYPNGDRALDLAIALESLLVDGSSEITYRLALRAALVAEPAVIERLRMRGLITALYSVRSSLIHNGVLSGPVKIKGRGKVDAITVVEEATVACAHILRKILMMGHLPDWDQLEVS